MKVGIITSASNDIEENTRHYLGSITTSVAGYLAKSNFDLSFGASSTSLMGICYREFLKEGRKITAVTTRKYEDDLNNLSYAERVICDTTFDMKKEIFENSDIIVALPGGFGTISELLSFIEEKRSNDKETPIEIYNEGGFYNKILETIKELQKLGLVSSDIDNYFKVSSNKEEFEEHIEKYRYEIENKGDKRL